MKKISITGKLKRRQPRLPVEAVQVLRSKGGSHGKRGYDRNKEKKWREDLSKSLSPLSKRIFLPNIFLEGNYAKTKKSKRRITMKIETQSLEMAKVVSLIKFLESERNLMKRVAPMSTCGMPETLRIGGIEKIEKEDNFYVVSISIQDPCPDYKGDNAAVAKKIMSIIFSQ